MPFEQPAPGSLVPVAPSLQERRVVVLGHVCIVLLRYAPPMHDREWATLLAEYNTWMNDRMYAVCRGLSDDDYHRDLGAFFGSVHLTLRHIFVIDILFVRRLCGRGRDASPQVDTLDALEKQRAQLDREIVQWAEGLERGALDEPFTVIPDTTRTVPAFVIATQMFNHQTHHRGQASALLTRLGVDIGATDIPA
ncbi:MAG: DinB family protein, partial [Myxococcota bacterium]